MLAVNKYWCKYTAIFKVYTTAITVCSAIVLPLHCFAD